MKQLNLLHQFQTRFDLPLFQGNIHNDKDYAHEFGTSLKDYADKLWKESNLSVEAFDNEIRQLNREYDSPLQEFQLVAIISTAKNGKRDFRQDNLTDLGNANRFVEIHKGNVYYCPENRSWYIWNGKYWEHDKSKKHIYKLAENVILQMHLEASKEIDSEKRKQLANHAFRLESNYALKQMLSLAEHKVIIELEEFDTHPNLITVQNGILDLNKGELIPFDKELKLTQFLPFPYHRGSSCPLWEKSMEVYFPNQDTRRYVQMLLGYAISGYTNETRFWQFYGRGSNGKSTLIEAFIEIFEPISDVIRYEELTLSKDKRNSHSTGLYDLRGKRAVFSTEIEQDVMFDSALIKQLTGDSYIKARKAHSNYSKSFKSTQKIILQGQEKPKFNDTTIGFERRPVIIPFFKIFNEEERTKFKKSDIIDSFLDEKEGILRWVVDGYLMYRKEKTLENLPEQIRGVTEGYLNDNDLLRQYIYTYCELGDDPNIYRMKVRVFKDEFNSWLMDIGERPVTTTWITRNLDNKDIRKGGQGNTFYLGIRLKENSILDMDFKPKQRAEILFTGNG